MSDIINTTKSTELSSAVQTIKSAILQSQQRALATINQEQLALYYSIGRFVSINTRNKNWGKGFIEAVSEQLRKELPGLRGFSAASLRKMRTFFEEWHILSDNSFVETNTLTNNEHNSFVRTNELPRMQFKIDANFPIAAFMNIGFTHHYTIISKVKEIEKRIDAHVHYALPLEAEQLIAFMDKTGTDMANLVLVPDRKRLTAVPDALMAKAKYPDRFYVFTSFDVSEYLYD